MAAHSWISERPAAHRLAQLLGLPDGTSDDELKRTFRRTVKTLHPDLVDAGTGHANQAVDLLEAHQQYVDELAGRTLRPSGGDQAAPPQDDFDPWNDEWDAPADYHTGGPPQPPSGPLEPPETDRSSSDGERSREPDPWWTPPPRGPTPRPGFSK